MSTQSSARIVAPHRSDFHKREFEQELRDTFSKRLGFDIQNTVVLGKNPDQTSHASIMVEMALRHAAENNRKPLLTESALDDLFSARRAARASCV